MRNAFSRMLVKAAQRDPRLVLLTGDHGYSLFDDFRRECPDKYINAGVAEQNMVGVAAGMAKAGYRPVVYGLSAFVPMRVLEQIKLDVCYENLPVLFIGDGAGLVYGTLGTSHQCTEDLAALRAMPNLNILSPADGAEMESCMQLASATSGPIYLRMGKADLGQIHSDVPAVRWGQPVSVREGTGPLAWIATGSMVSTAMTVASHWPDSAIWSVPSIKPLAVEPIVKLASRHQTLIVLEEHSIFGGLGAAVAEIVTEHCPTWVCRIGTLDRFSQKCGSYGYLLKEHRLDAAAVTERVREFLSSARPSAMRTAQRPLAA